MSGCVTLWFDWGAEPSHPPNCPNCGRFLKNVGPPEWFTCGCDGILVIEGSGDPEFDGDEDAIRICKKPDVRVLNPARSDSNEIIGAVLK